jgi:hypothetical protein
LVTHTGHKSKKRKTEEENDEKISAKVQMNIVLPSSLKKQLVSDWEYITKDNLLVPLPRTPTVKVLLQQYLEEVGGEHKKDTIQEVCFSMCNLFDLSFIVSFIDLNDFSSILLILLILLDFIFIDITTA